MSIDSRLRHAADDARAKVTGLNPPPIRGSRRRAMTGWAIAGLAVVLLVVFLVPRLTSNPAVGDDCLVGTWVLDNESFQEGYKAILADAGIGDAEVNDLGGTYTIDMQPDGTFIAKRDSWGYSVTSRGETYALMANGDESGIWSVDGPTIAMTTDVSDVTVDMSREVDGELVPLPRSQPFDAPSITTTGDYGCSGDVTTISSGGVFWVMHRG